MNSDSKNIKIMHGNEACSEGAIIAGCNLFAGYPITPASEISEVMANRMPQMGAVFMQMEDELASINLLCGASWGGLKVMTGTSGPGLDLMQEGIGFAYETEAPMVIVNVQRGGPGGGQATMGAQGDVMSARYGNHGDTEMIVLAASSAQEALDLTIRAFNLSEKYLMPVILLTDEIVGHTRENVVLPENAEIFNRVKPEPGESYLPFGADESTGFVPKRLSFGEGAQLMVDAQLHDELGVRCGHLVDKSAKLVRRLANKVLYNIDDISDYELRETEDAELIVVSYGSVARPALRAMKEARAEDLKVGWVKLRTVYPFPDKLIRSLAEHCKKFVVPEMNLGRIIKEVEWASKLDAIPVTKIGGELHTPQDILDVIKEALK